MNEGGAIEIGGGQATMSHNTVWNNTSNTHNLTTAIHQSGGTLYLHNSIIGRDAAGGGPLCGGTQTGKYLTTGNLSWNDTGVTQSCLGATPSNPKFGAKTGTVPYFPLGAGSAAIGLGVDAECALYPVDQAGKSRPATGCDSGAVQYIAPPASEVVVSGDGIYVAPARATKIACTGEWLNENTNLRVSASYGLCNGVQFQRVDRSGIGIGWLLDGGFVDAVDVWGWVQPTVEVCFPQAGKTLFLDASTSPRTVSPLDSFVYGNYTCARIGKAGTIALMAPDSPHGNSPAANAPAPLGRAVRARPSRRTRPSRLSRRRLPPRLPSTAL